MADYRSSSATGSKGRFGSMFKSWAWDNDARTDPWASFDHSSKPNPLRDHICRPVIVGPDGRAVPAVVDCPPKHRQRETVNVVEEGSYRVQPVSPQMTDCVPAERRMGFSGGLFQRPRTTEPALITEGGWARPSPEGWKTPPAQPLGTVTNNIDTAAEYLRELARPTSGNGWARSGPNGWNSQQPKGHFGVVVNDYPGVMAESTRPTSGNGWARSGPNGWNSQQPKERLGIDVNDIGVAEYVRESLGPIPAASTGRRGMTGEFGGKKATTSIDSREAVKKYGGQYI